MKKKSRRPRSSETSRQTSRTQTTVGVGTEKRPPGNRGRPRKTVPVTTDSFYHDNTAKDKTANVDCRVAASDDTQKYPQSKSRSSGACLRTSANELPLVTVSSRERSNIVSICWFWVLTEKTLICYFVQQVDCQLPSVGSATGSSLHAACGTPSTSGLRIPSILLMTSLTRRHSHPFYFTQTSSNWSGSSWTVTPGYQSLSARNATLSSTSATAS